MNIKRKYATLAIGTIKKEVEPVLVSVKEEEEPVSVKEEVKTINETDGSLTIFHTFPTANEEDEEHGNDNTLDRIKEYDNSGGELGAMQNNKTFFCPHCGNCTSSAGSLKLHMRACLIRKQGIPEEDRKCKMCNRVFSAPKYLKEHLLRHNGGGPKRCPRCSRKFVIDEQFKAHMERHKQKDKIQAESESVSSQQGGSKNLVVKEYTCCFCSENFTVSFEVGCVKRRYACDPCRDKYSNAEMSKRHNQIVEEKHKFPCYRCGRKFVFAGFLQRHIPTCNKDEL